MVSDQSLFGFSYISKRRLPAGNGDKWRILEDFFTLDALTKYDLKVLRLKLHRSKFFVPQ